MLPCLPFVSLPLWKRLLVRGFPPAPSPSKIAEVMAQCHLALFHAFDSVLGFADEGLDADRISVPAGQAGKLMYVMHNSEYPLSCFALFENGPCLIADTNFDVLMVKLKGFFQSAKASKIETRGTRYQYCDFLVKVGTVTMGPSARGISVEVRLWGNSSMC